MNWKERLNYNSETGIFTWKVNTARTKIGQIAGRLTPTGYRQIGHDTRYAHRLAWYFMKGEWPMGEIDHINGDRDDNRWLNLRLVSRRENCENRKAPSPQNSTGLLGVSRKRGKFSARIKTHGRTINLGVFATPHEAHAVYMAAKKKIHRGAI